MVKLSAKGFLSAADSAEIVELKGYQNILAIWDKLEKGEIQEDEISATLKLVIDGGIYKANQISVVLESSGARTFTARFLSMELRVGGANAGELYISNYTFAVAHIKSTTVKFTTFDGQEHSIKGAFID